MIFDLFNLFTQITQPENDEHGWINELEYEKSGHVQEKVDEVGDCGLSLSLSLHHPIAQMSNTSSTSETSETYSRNNQSDQSSSKCSVNLDLSIALCLWGSYACKGFLLEKVIFFN